MSDQNDNTKTPANGVGTDNSNEENIDPQHYLNGLIEARQRELEEMEADAVGFLGRSLLRIIATDITQHCEAPFDEDDQLNGEGLDAIVQIISQSAAEFGDSDILTSLLTRGVVESVRAKFEQEENNKEK